MDNKKAIQVEDFMTEEEESHSASFSLKLNKKEYERKKARFDLK